MARNLDWKDLNRLVRDLKSRVYQIEQLTRYRPGQSGGVLETLGEVRANMAAMELESRNRSRALATLSHRVNLLAEDDAFARRLAAVVEGHEGRLASLERDHAGIRALGDAIEKAPVEDVDLIAQCMAYLGRAGRGRPAPRVVREAPSPVGVA
ncbi:MAG: hypothetical protein ACLP81_07135 [Acidimicrobiales bacterium]